MLFRSGVVTGVVGNLRNLPPSANQAPQYAVALDDVPVKLNIDGGRHKANQARDVRGAADLLKLELIDRVIPEPSGGNHWAPRQAADNLRSALLQELTQLQALSEQELLDQRYAKFRRMGRFLEAGTQDPSLSS